MRQEHQILKLQLSKRKKLRLQKQPPTWARRLLFPPARYFVIALFLIKMFFEIFISRSFTCQWKLIGDALIPGWRGGGLFTNLQQRRRRGCGWWFQWISLNQCGFNLFVRKRDREKAKLKEDVPVHGCKIQGRYTCAWLQCFNAGKASGPKCEVKSRVHLITHLDMVTQVLTATLLWWNQMRLELHSGTVCKQLPQVVLSIACRYSTIWYGLHQICPSCLSMLWKHWSCKSSFLLPVSYLVPPVIHSVLSKSVLRLEASPAIHILISRREILRRYKV